MPDLWSIYHIDNCHYTIPPKPKYVAIVCKDTDFYYGFLINSKVHPWLLKDPYRKSCQVVLLASEHRIQHDSYINCFELFHFFESELVNFRCALNKNTSGEIKNVVTNSISIEKDLKKLILK